ncbi:MAG: hypothetical protein M1828_001807, partial [Chrysothrix sp. TS-e1954]
LERPMPTDYHKWTNEDLIARVNQLEADLRAQNQTGTPSQPDTNQIKIKKPVGVDASKYATRPIALKFAYLGQGYAGLEYSKNATQVPTVEEVLWKALARKRLIFKDEDGPIEWDNCDYSKCGRTDVGVSAFGQVVGIRVRSNKKPQIISDGTRDEPVEKQTYDSINDELPYCQMLNSVLPPDVKALAWSPVSEDFSARHTCKQRRYRYFFTQPAFLPIPTAHGVTERHSGSEEREGWLDIAMMSDAAKRFEGEHDFQNICKIDPSRQFTHHRRRVELAKVEEVPLSGLGMEFLHTSGFGPRSLEFPERYSRVYSITVWGSGFLWHQVRHMAAILFLVGQRLEKPSIVSELLDLQRYPQRPVYPMADDHPLVLWDCMFPGDEGFKGSEEVRWIYPEEQEPDPARGFNDGLAELRFGYRGMIETLWNVWRKRKMDEIISAQLIDRLTMQPTGEYWDPRSHDKSQTDQGARQLRNHNLSSRMFFGADAPRPRGKYVPLAKRAVLEPLDVINEKYAKKQIALGKPVRSYNQVAENDNKNLT